MTGTVSSILKEAQKCAITERRNEVGDESLKNALCRMNWARLLRI